MKILLLTDKPNWAYHSISQSLQKYNPDSSIKLSVMHIKGNERAIKKRYNKFDRILIMGWQTYDRIKFIDKKNAMTGIHSHHSWDNKKTTPDKDVDPPQKLISFLSGFQKVNTVSQRLYNLFKKNGLGNLYYTPNGVDTNIFTCNSHVSSKKFTVGYSGSSAHDWRKGVTKFIIPSAKKAGVRTKIAMLNSNTSLSLKEMPTFYHKIDCYVCASSSEGFSLSTLEAASSGRPIISTRCGGSDELIRDGKNGFLVNREVNSIVEKIILLKNNPKMFYEMSVEMRKFVVNHYGWDKASLAWIQFMSN